MSPTPAATNERVLTAVNAQIADLQPLLDRQVDIADVLAKLAQLTRLLDGNHGLPAEASLLAMLSAPTTKEGLVKQVTDIQEGTAGPADLGKVLVNLYAFQAALADAILVWRSTPTVKNGDIAAIEEVVLSAIIRVKQLLSYRPDVSAILDDLTAIKNLRGGPADAVAFHDFHVLQLAFKSVWMHAFGEDLKDAAARLYDETVALYDEAGLTAPSFSAIQDVTQLQQFVQAVSTTLGLPATQPASPRVIPAFRGVRPMASGGGNTVPPPPAVGISAPISTEVLAAYPEASLFWNQLSQEQQNAIRDKADIINNPSATQRARDTARKTIEGILQTPIGRLGRLQRLILEIGRALSEPYAFDVFAPDSFNYGLMITYRQRWEPGPYQAGELVATIPLAPGETRKFSKKRVTKTSRMAKEIEKHMETRSLQSTEDSRAESEIMANTVAATNFKMTTSGSFNIGIGSIGATSEMGGSASQESTTHKKDFHEATLKAAEEYRQERSIEVETSTSVETEETMSGEISNPNNEITVTYLFYELQRRYQIREFLHRVRPVILVAQDVPAPHEIDEAWLLQYQWILARVLLDDSLRPALSYLTSGFAGDEAAIEIIKAQWIKQRSLVEELERQAGAQLQLRDRMREDLVAATLEEDSMPEMPGALKFFTFGVDPSEGARTVLEANRKAGETRLKYVETALADAQDKLRQATGAFADATKAYAEAMQKQYTRHVAIDQLRVHVKQNILYYMQAIWSHEDADQRFFRLYNKKVFCPQPLAGCTPRPRPVPRKGKRDSFSVEFSDICVPGAGGAVGGLKHELVEVADLDNPLGYKGNYIIFPLKDECPLTTYMLSEYLDNYLGLRDPDGSDDFDAESFDERWKTAMKNQDQPALDGLRKDLEEYITQIRRRTDEIIVPTGQLLIEALPGSHPLLEDFKLLHRVSDLKNAKAAVRHAELENLRLAARVATAQDGEPALLEDPDIEKRIIVSGNSALVVDSNS